MYKNIHLLRRFHKWLTPFAIGLFGDHFLSENQSRYHHLRH